MTGRRAFWLTAALATLLIVVSVSGLVDEPSQNYADAALKRALVTFAVARTLNGVISVAQGTDIALEPAGVGVILAAGEILDPVNDLLEQFSAVMLVASTSLGIQAVLLRMSAWWGTSVLLAVTAAALLLLGWLRPAWPDWARALTRRLFAAAVFLRFAVPLLVIANHLLFQTFLLPEQEKATAALRDATTEIRSLNDAEQAPTPDPTLSGRVSRFFRDGFEALDVQQKLDAFRETLATTTERIVDLIVVFVLQTVLIPLAILWLFGRLMRALAG